MGWWKRKEIKASEVADPPAAPSTKDRAPAVEDVGGPALDTIAHMLRTYGQRAFDVGDAAAASIRETCEAWARHILVKSPKPGDPAPHESADDADAPPPAIVHRDWVGLRHYFGELRKKEGAYVSRSVGDLRETIWTFVHGLSTALSHGRSEDTQMSEQLGRLRKAVEMSSTDDIKREALEAVQLVDRLVSARRSREDEQVATLGERLNQLRGELDAARQEMTLDSLTGLYNRGAFDQKVLRAVDLGNLLGESACLLMIDADNFKAVNDTYGHPIGDEVLRRLALTCLRCFPRKDDFVARYGGEEFAAILSIHDAENAARIAERFLDTVRALRVQYEGGELGITVSAGLALLRPGDDALGWVARADRALYAAKQGGRDRFVLADAPEPKARAAA